MGSYIDFQKKQDLTHLLLIFSSFCAPRAAAVAVAAGLECQGAVAAVPIGGACHVELVV